MHITAPILLLLSLGYLGRQCNANAMQIIVMLYCPGNNDKSKSLHMSEQMPFFKKKKKEENSNFSDSSDLRLVDCMAAEALGSEDCL